MSDCRDTTVNVTQENTSVDCTQRNTTVDCQVGSSVKPVYKDKKFVGDGTNQTIVLDGYTAIAGSIKVWFSGAFGEVDVNYTVASDNKSITLLNNWQTGRKGEIRYEV